MERHWLCLVAALVGFLVASTPTVAAPPPFELKDGDRVVFLGNTFLEREQRYGYIETALSSAYPDHQIIFRNLSWSGDTVRGEARAYFGAPKEGYAHLIKHVTEFKPTVILFGYGANAAFEGQAGLERFDGELKRLLDDLDKTTARIVILSPTAHENLGAPLPDPTAHNARLKLYTEHLKAVAAKRNYPFVNLLKLKPAARCVYKLDKREDKIVKVGESHRFKLTDNGMHLTALGYWQLARTSFDPRAADRTWVVRLGANGKLVDAQGVKVVGIKATDTSVRFAATEPVLPLPTIRVDLPDDKKVLWALDRLWSRTRMLRVAGLKAGTYELKIDGKAYGRFDASKIATFIPVPRSPEFDRAEALRQAIVRKNELFFHRYRPQNVTYLYLFRKREQGNNAVEIPKFDPLIAEAEKQIAELRKPKSHVYELVRVEGGAK